MAVVNVGFPVQETSSEVDSGNFSETPLSVEETPNPSISQGPKPKVYKGNNSTSTVTFKGEHVFINKTRETNKVFTSDGNSFTESGHNGYVVSKPNDNICGHHGGNASNSRTDDCTNIDIYTDAKSCKLQDGDNTDTNNTIELENETSTDHGRNNDDLSCFRPSTEETDVNDGIGKALDGNNPNDKSSTGLEHDSHVKKVIRPGNFTPLTLKLEDRVTADSEENLTLESHRSNNGATKVVFESGHKGNVAFKPNDNIHGHHGGNASISKTDDGTNIDIYTDATSCKLQGEVNTAKNNTKELENKTSTDHGRNNDDLLCFRPTTEETHVKEGNGKALEVTSPTDKSSTGLEQHSIVIEVIRPGNHPTMVLKSEDGARAGSKENNLTFKSHRSDNSATKVFESGHNGDVDCQHNGEIFAHHDATSSISGGGQTGGNASSFRIDDGAPCCMLQGEANTAKTTTYNGGGNNDYLYHGPNINETDVREENKSLDGNIPNNGSSTGCEQVINVIRKDIHTTVYYNHKISKSEDSSTEGSDINNTATKTFESGHHLDVGNKIFAHHKVKNNFSATSQTGGNVFRIDDSMDINTCHTTTCFRQQGAKLDKYNPIDSEIKTSTDQGGDNNTLSCHESNIKETDVKEGKSEICNGSCLNDNSVTRSYDDTAMIMELGDGSTTGFEENNLALEGDRSSTCAAKVCKSEDNGDESYRHNGEIFAYRKVNPSVTEAIQTGENASSFRISGGTNIDAHPTTTYCKVELDQNNAIDLEIEFPRDYGEGNNDFSYCRQTINEPDVRYDNSTAGPPQDSTEVIKSDDQTTITLRPDNSATEDCEKNNSTLGQNGSDSTMKVFGSEPNGDVECRAHDGACKIGGKTSTDLSPSTFRINDGTNRNAHIRGRRKDRNPDDKTFSSHRRDNNDLSRHRPKSQHQNCDSLTSTNSADVQQDGTGSVITTRGDHVSLPCISRICNPLETKMDKYNHSKPSSGVYNPWKVLPLILWMMPLADAAPTRDFTVTSQMRSYHFCADGFLIGQLLTINDMDNRTGLNCTINFTSVGFFHNCLESGYLFFGKNETCVEMLTMNLNTTDYNMKYTITWNGDYPNGHPVPGTPGDLLSAAEVMAKIAKYTKTLNTTPAPLNGQNNTTTAPLYGHNNTTTAPLYGHNNTTKAQEKGDHSKTSWIIAGLLVAGLAVGLCVLGKNWSKFKSWVDSCRRRNTNRASNNENNECAIPLREMANGHMNGHVPNEESQQEN
ncbi:putative uncharacterized protein DDB_G0282133 isoform X2 [Hyla sarda]|nr:putative uncharacterized protein DDB_G0282133 isoform X2 [Hyla sarda]XP_056399569.1 putative uncharacterized protein DDB_G0282133 isoform X2 [Hyla sarda]